jgi:hypothetical protein
MAQDASTPVSATQPAVTAEAGRPAELNALSADVLADRQYIVLRADVSIASPSKWHDVRFRLLDSRGVPVTRRDGRPWAGLWGQIFTPSQPSRARYGDLRLAVAFDTLAELMGPAEPVVQVLCEVVASDSGRVLNQLPPMSLHLMLRRDQAGKLVGVTEFMRIAAEPGPVEPAADRGVKTTLMLEHLSPRNGLEVLTQTIAGRELITLRHRAKQALLASSARGFAFEAVDSEAKAIELALLPRGGDVVLTRKQASVVLDALADLTATTRPAGEAASRPAESSPAGANEQVDRTPALTPARPAMQLTTVDAVQLPDGVETTAVGKLGHIVRAVLLTGGTGSPRDVVLCEWHVGADGGLFERFTVLARIPELEPSGPPSPATQAATIAPGDYERAVKDALRGQVLRVVPTRAEPGRDDPTPEREN